MDGLLKGMHIGIHMRPTSVFDKWSTLNDLQCLDESKAPMVNMRKQECKEWLEDYTECLHRQKQVDRYVLSVVRYMFASLMRIRVVL